MWLLFAGGKVEQHSALAYRIACLEVEGLYAAIGGVMVCSIFMASITISGMPFST